MLPATFTWQDDGASITTTLEQIENNNRQKLDLTWTGSLCWQNASEMGTQICSEVTENLNVFHYRKLQYEFESLYHVRRHKNLSQDARYEVPLKYLTILPTSSRVRVRKVQHLGSSWSCVLDSFSEGISTWEFGQ